MSDLISRQAALEALKKNRFPGAHYIDTGVKIALREIKALPSVRPERKRGKWIDYANSHCECSVCHTEWSYFQNEVECFEFCPNCGADMREDDHETD